MTMKMLVAPLTLGSLAMLLVGMQAHIPCILMALANFVSHVSL